MTREVVTALSRELVSTTRPALLPVRVALTRLSAIEEPKPYVTEEEANRAADLLADAGRVGRCMFIRFLWLTGARVSEALAVRPRDLDVRTHLVELRTLKRGRPPELAPVRTLPLPPSYLASLLYLATLDRTPPDAPLWPWCRSHAFRVVRDALVAVGVEHRPGDGVGGKSWGRKRGTGRAHPHAFRHGHAIHALRAGVSLDIVARALGHASVTTTSGYLKATAADVRGAYGGIFR
jgi:integrase/recombinase XerD